MPINQDSPLGAVGATLEIIGGKAPFVVTLGDFPNNLGGFFDVATTDSDQVFDFALNDSGVASLPNDARLTGQVTVVDALKRSVTFNVFSLPLGSGIGPGDIAPVTGSFFDNADLDTVVISLGAINAIRPVVWSIVSGFDNGTGTLLTMQDNGQMTLNADGVTYYGAHPGDGTLAGFVTFVDDAGRSPVAPVEITLSVFASGSGAVVASISLVHAIA